MALETATYISDLVATNPEDATDTGASMGDHLKLIKSTVKATFPNISGAVTPTHTQINTACTPMEAVIAPTLLNSWVNSGGSSQTAGYWKDPFGDVHLQGLIKDGTVGTSAFTLPLGYRPTKNETFAVIANGSANFVGVNSDGTVPISVTASNVYVSLAGITFRAA